MPTGFSDWALIVATFTGPVAAVQAQKWIERSRDKREQKQQIFRILMASRAIRASSAEHVQALNLIDVFFDGKHEECIRDAWALYFNFLSETRDMTNWSAEQHKNHDDRSIDLLVALLKEMSDNLGFDFNKVQLGKGAYWPQGHFDDVLERGYIRKFLANSIKSTGAIPMAVTQLPVSEAALQKQGAVQDALLETLTGRTAIKVKQD